jgi:hypothetical protein
MISPSRSPRGQQRTARRLEMERSQEHFCSNENHPYKKADYFIHIESEDMYYCGVCATQAASQGFPVNRIEKSRKNRAMPNHPEYTGNRRYGQIQELMKTINSLEGDFRKVEPRRVGEHYQQQEDLLNCFYQEMITLVEKMRNDHIADLQAEAQRNAQLAATEQESLRVAMEELHEAWEDIEVNLQEIIENVDQPNYETCMKQYFSNIQRFQNRLEEQQEQMDLFTTYQQQDLSLKVKLFEEQLVALWNHQPQPQSMPKQVRMVLPERKGTPLSERNRSIKSVHEMLPKQASQNCEGQGAFRNLFPEEESEDRLPEASPQFKAF